MDKYEKRRFEEHQQNLAKIFVDAVCEISDCDVAILRKFKQDIFGTKDRITWQNVIAKYYQYLTIEKNKLKYAFSMSDYSAMTSEKEWKNYRGHLLYLLSTLIPE